MKFSEEQIAFLKSFNGEKTYKELAKLFQDKYEINFVSLSYFRRCLRKANIDYKYIKTNSGSFKRGFTPWNKGMKTNIKPKNLKGLESERITKKGYILIKIKEPNVWELKHRFLWKQVNGKIPKGSVIIFANGDKTNFDLDNLICVSKNELRQLNRYKLKKDDAELTKAGIGIVKLKAKLYEIKKKKKN
ncbi:HNH nuclease domain-containing protein [Fusobacterium sp. oral taxon C10]